ncbi:hypothetical protein [Thermophagus xiamenensis]|uniref:Uncharacterized protein n=1 Tax=Thermophagus xiamenensis TaxID=385682 RepID=A0A1I1VXD7_9BACT|nr:hypothetical protein [Thermophagus xiamenensis]SFD85703.1 hypothetical protein SAMN05444380_10336 [Thermophagus xiamenensis]
MNFLEAIKLKSRIGNKIIINGVELKVFVSPTSKGKFDEYLAVYRENENSFSDEIAKLYAVNKDFACCGIGYFQDIIVYKFIWSENDIEQKE